MKVMMMIMFLAMLFLTGGLRHELDIIKQEVSSLNVRIHEITQEHEQTVAGLEQQLQEVMDELTKYEIFEFEATGYAPYDNRSGICHDGDPTSTATGTTPRPGVIAVNPQIIPYGTELYVDGYGWAVAEDTGGAIRNREDLIDLFFETYDEAVKWGRERVPVLSRKGVVNREPLPSEAFQGEH